MKGVLLSLVLTTLAFGQIFSGTTPDGSFVAEKTQIVVKVNVLNSGYMQITKAPTNCGTVFVLDDSGKLVGDLNMNQFTKNIKISKGSIKIQVVPTKGACTISYLVPE